MTRGKPDPWRTDEEATRLAEELFAGTSVAKRNGEQYLFTGTPFGRLELLRLPGGRRFLAAAESPPPGSPLLDISGFPGEVVRHLKRCKLRPFRVLAAPGGQVSEALRRLARREAPGGGSTDSGCWSPFLCPLERDGEVVGEARRTAAARLAALLRACEEGSYLPALIGFPGAGKRAAAAAVAEVMGLRPVELPLGRLLIERVFQTPVEAAVETALAAAGGLAEDELLVVSGGEATRGLTSSHRRQLGDELARLKRVVLLSSVPAPMPQAVVLELPGLTHPDEVLSLIEESHPDLEVEGPVCGMLGKAARVPKWGMIPGRILLLVRLALSLRGDGGPPERLSPDDAAPAVQLASRGWTCAPSGGENGDP